MSIISAMYTGVTGLVAESDALGVIGDNIANANTVGFKQQKAQFEDLLGRSPSANSNQPGAGVHVSGVAQDFTQGSLNSTGVSTDLALNGDGFFVAQGTAAGVAGTYYERNGQFNVSATGALQDTNGLNIQGYASQKGGTFSSALSTVTIPSGTLPPQQTGTISIVANLSSTSATPAATFDPANPAATSNFSTSLSTYDSLGNSHELTVYFVNQGSGNWAYHVLGNGSEITTPPATAGQAYTDLSDGTLSFSTAGALTGVNGAAAPATPFNVTFANASTAQPITLNLGSIAGVGTGTGLDGLTQFAAASNVSSQAQDGYAAASLTGVNINTQGIVQGVYSNGQNINIAQLAVAKFQSNQGLAREGGNLWENTQQSGQAAVGTAGSGGRASLSSGSLEQSNVDIATQFVALIAHQEAYSADSKTVTTADQMLQQLMTIKQ